MALGETLPSAPRAPFDQVESRVQLLMYNRGLGHCLQKRATGVAVDLSLASVVLL